MSAELDSTSSVSTMTESSPARSDEGLGVGEASPQGQEPERPEGSDKSVLHGFLAIVDQALFAGGNFATSLIVARSSTPAVFGLFSLIYLIVQFLGTVHVSVVAEPMMVFGSGRLSDKFGQYLSAVVRLQWVVSAVLSAPLAVGALIAFAMMRPDAGAALAVAAFAGPLLYLQWLLRRACYARQRESSATRGGLVYFGAVVIALSALQRVGSLTPGMAFGVIGLSSLLSSAAMLGGLRIAGLTLVGMRPENPEMFREHLRYGAWSLPASFMMWVPGNLPFVVLPVIAGMAATGRLTASTNLVMPILQVNSALALLIVPRLVRTRFAHGLPVFKREILETLLVFGLGALAYGALLAPNRAAVMHFVYGAKYAGADNITLLAALLPLLATVGTVLGAAFRALEMPDVLFRVYAIATAVMLSAGLALMFKWGLFGGVAALLLSSTVVAAAFGFSYLRWLKGV